VPTTQRRPPTRRPQRGAGRPSVRLVERRIGLLFAIFLLLLGLAGLRAMWLGTVKSGSLSDRAVSQQIEDIAEPARRGTIFDRNGVPLALGEQATTVYADPTQVTDPRRVALAAERALGIDADSIYPELTDRSRAFVYLKRKADPAEAAKLERRDLAGVGFYSEERRRYPQAGVAAQVLGFAGDDNDGLAGLELSLDDVLRGEPGKETVLRDPFGRVVDVLSETAERPGRDVFLTIDHRIQARAEEVLRSTVRQWGAKAATAVVLDPRNGAVLAMATAPGFNANDFSKVRPDYQRNRAVIDTYEPGSTFKLIPVAGALSEGLVAPSTPFTLAPSIQVADRVINEHDPRPTVQMTVAEIVSQSSNVGAITLAQRLGSERLASWVKRFGFGRSTGIDFPGETRGLVLPLERWSGSTIGNLPIGQGIAVTPVQMAAAYASVASGGVWIQPHLVDHVAGGRRTKPERRRVVSPQVAEQLSAMLTNVVADGGTGTLAAVPGYKVAGKTGTASKPLPDGSGYSTSKYVASFVGFVPASRPELVILVTVDEPTTIWGGVVAAPAFQEIARFALQYLEVPPDLEATAR
jgi:cell division protein FtsI (penicillin-binding protein 3)